MLRSPTGAPKAGAEGDGAAPDQTVGPGMTYDWP